MVTIEKLAEYGANTKEGIERCMGMEDFYLQLVGMMFEDENFAKLESAVESGDVRAAFEASHALKGTLGNLSITPLFDPVSKMTERFRGATEPVDVSDLMPVYREAYEGFMALK